MAQRSVGTALWTLRWLKNSGKLTAVVTVRQSCYRHPQNHSPIFRDDYLIWTCVSRPVECRCYLKSIPITDKAPENFIWIPKLTPEDIRQYRPSFLLEVMELKVYNKFKRNSLQYFVTINYITCAFILRNRRSWKSLCTLRSEVFTRRWWNF